MLAGRPRRSRASHPGRGRALLRNVSTAAVPDRSQARLPTMRCPLIVRHGRLGGAEQPVLAPSLLRCNSFAFRARSGRAHFYNPNHDRRRPSARRQTSLDAESPGTRRVSTAGEYWVCPSSEKIRWALSSCATAGSRPRLDGGRRRDSPGRARTVRLPRAREHVRRHSRPRTHHHRQRPDCPGGTKGGVARG
jgi:hypothetical protein